MFRLKSRFIRITPGFWLMLAGLAWIDRESGVLPWGILACAVHEMGHMGAALLMGAAPERMLISAVGAELTLRNSALLPYWKDMLIAMSGPLANILLGSAAAAYGAWIPAIMSFSVGGFNLLPVVPLDGGRMLYMGLCGIVDHPWPGRILRITSGISIGLLLGLGLIAALEYANGALAVTAVWLLIRTTGKGEKFE